MRRADRAARPRRASAGPRRCGPRRRRRARAASRGCPRRPVAGSRPRSSSGDSGHGEQRRVLEPTLGEHPGQVPAHLGDGAGRGPVEHDRHGGAALGGLLEEAPRHLVGVARGRGDEQPEVGGREQLRGQAAVALHDGVDVGRVEQREPLRHRGGRHQLQRAGVGGRARWCARGRAGSAAGRTSSASSGWWTRTGERVVGRSTPGSLTRAPTSELTSVDLPAPVDPPTTVSSGASIWTQPRQHVVLELVDHLREVRPAARPTPGISSGRRTRLQRLAQAGQRRQHLGGARAPLRPTGRLSRRVPGVRHRPAPLPGTRRAARARVRPALPRLRPDQSGSQGAHPVDVLLAERREVGRGDAAQEAAVQEAELDRLVLVGDHRRAVRAGPPTFSAYLRAKRRAGIRASHGISAGSRKPRWAQSLSAAVSTAALAATRPDREAAEQQERRDHQEEVGGDRVAAVVEHQRGVPGRVRADGDEVADRTGRATRTAAAAGAHRDADADAGEGGEERVRERAEDAAHDEQPDGSAEAAGVAVLAHVRRGQVEDVLGEGEADAHHPGVHQAVEDAVELVAAVDQQQQDEQPLGRLLGDRRDDRGREGVGVLEDDAVEELQHQRARGGDERTPAEAEDEQRARLGLVAVQPHVDRRSAGRPGSRPGRRPDDERSGGSGEQQDEAHDRRADEHHHRDDDGEGGIAPASLHARSVTRPHT